MLEINPSLVILTTVVFLGLIAILNPMLYKPMLKFIDERNTSIKNDEESANKNVSDLNTFQAEVDSIIQNARNEAIKIKQEALSVAKGVALKDIETKRSALEADYEAFLSALNVQKDELRADLVSKLPELKSVFNDKLVRI